VFLKQSLTIAAYEGAHTALAPNATATDIRNTCNQILADRRVRDATITLVPADPAAVPEGEFMEVRISAPADSNNMVPGRFFGGRTMRASAVMMKEL